MTTSRNRSVASAAGRTLGGLAALGAAGLAYAHLESKLFTVRGVTVPILPAGSPDLRVLHISDLHVTPTQHTKLEWISSLATLAPDLVINTGDNLAHVDAVEPLLEAFGDLLHVPGAFVFGSNDYYAPHFKNPARYLLPDSRVPLRTVPDLPWERLRDTMTGAGWLDLTNRRDTLTVDAVTFDVVGVDDPHLDRDVFPEDASGTAGVDGSHVRIGVTHAPYVRVLDQMHDDGADLIIAGHTHGGQLCVPGFGALVTNCDLDRSRASGLHGWPGARPDAPGGDESTWLHVSAGAGTSPYTPFRFACRPEATLITLTERAG